METLVPWKKRRDVHQDSDNVLGCGDQVEGFAEMEAPSLTGSPRSVKFIMKDETNAQAMKHLGILGRFQGRPQPSRNRFGRFSKSMINKTRRGY